MARGTLSGNQGQSSGGWFRGNRGRFSRGRGRFAVMQQGQGPTNYQSGQGLQQSAAMQGQSGQPGPRPNLDNVQCFKCRGWGHLAPQCPSARSVQFRGGRSGGRARGRMQRGRGRGGRARGRSQSVKRLPGRVQTRSSCTAATGAGGCPSARTTRSGKLAEPHYGQLCLLGARLERLARHEARAWKGGVCEGIPTKRRKTDKYISKEEYDDVVCKKEKQSSSRRGAVALISA